MLQHKLKSLNSLELRKSNKTIIFSHISNFVNKDYWILPELNNRVSYYAYPDWLEYFYARCGMKHLPFHFYINSVKDDWNIVNCMPLDYKSHWLESMVKNDYLDQYYQNAIVVAVQDNFSLNTPDIRALELMGFQIIAPFIRLNYTNIRDSIVWFDEVFKFKNYDKDMSSRDSLDNPYRYNVVPMKFFDRVIFNLSVMRFI